MPATIWEYLSDNVALTADSGTVYLDLPRGEQIMEILLEWRATNSATAYPLHSILDSITKVEVLADGVKTLYSATAEIGSYLAFVQRGGLVPDHTLRDTPSETCVMRLPIIFGRYPGDVEFLLDTSLYRHCQLRIEYVDTTTYIGTGSFKHTVTYRRPLERLSPVGFVRHRVVKTEASAAAGTVRHDLPLGYPWFLAGVRMDDYDADVSGNITDVDLNIDSGRLHLVNLHMAEIMQINRMTMPNPSAYFVRLACTGNEDSHHFGAWPIPFSLNNDSGSPIIIGMSSMTGEKFMCHVLDSDGHVTTTEHAVVLNFPSSMPHACVMLFDGRAEAFNAPSYNEAWLDYTTGSNTQTIHTFLSELIRGGCKGGLDQHRG